MGIHRNKYSAQNLANINETKVIIDSSLQAIERISFFHSMAFLNV